jgi:hypothetical protein
MLGCASRRVRRSVNLQEVMMHPHVCGLLQGRALTSRHSGFPSPLLCPPGWSSSGALGSDLGRDTGNPH